MATYQYELLKCDSCGKSLGYIYVSVTTWPRQYWFLQGRESHRIEKIAFCEGCFRDRQSEKYRRRSESESEEDESVKSQGESKDKRMIR